MSESNALRRADEAEALAQCLLKFAGALRSAPLSDPKLDWPQGQTAFARTIESLLALRHLRAEHVDARVFGEPAWELLLTLYHAHLDGTAASITSLLQATGTYPSTACRWLDALVDLGLVAYEQDTPNSAALTQEGVLRMTRALVAMQEVADFGGWRRNAGLRETPPMS